ncbi:uncharacterized protein LOC124699092 isoform X2 [Lolium rigidum]|uniref:uncharacterized protein LOC124699092 isoform X2 n=1 Tax=Lolium rigidum TaxID=89674 RepID=UPI001F5DB775|nr:uncharacterized protein LOC124699092 isoform X2 [Lolium rigidum]
MCQDAIDCFHVLQANWLLPQESRCGPGAVPVTMSQRAGETVSYLFSPAPSMASSRRICWVTTTRSTDGAWINTDKTLPASLFSSKKKERRKVGLSDVGTAPRRRSAARPASPASAQERRWCTEVILEVDQSAAVTGRLEASGSEPILHLLFSSQNHLIGRGGKPLGVMFSCLLSYYVPEPRWED